MSESNSSSQNSSESCSRNATNGSRRFDGAEFFDFTSFRLHTLLVESQALIGNPLRDPTSRRHPVLVPKDRAPASGWPVVFVLAGFSGNGPNYFNLKTFESNFPQTLDTLVNQREAPRAVYVFVEAMTYWGGSQFLNSPMTGNYEDYLVMDVVGAVRNKFEVSQDACEWCVMGGSSGGYGALHLGSRHPEVFGHVAAIAPDCFFEASLLPEYWTALPVLEKLGGVAGVRAELESGKLQRRKEWHSILNAVAMGLCYSRAGDSVSFPVPLDRHTGCVNQVEWTKWKKHDPIVFLAERIERVKKLNGLYIDVGTRDQYHLQFGARQIREVLKENHVAHQYTEFEGNHFDIGERRPQVWRWLMEFQGWNP